MGKDIRELHNFLWMPGWDGDSEQLRADLWEESQALDDLLGAEGKLQRNVKPLLERWKEMQEGAALFELLHHIYFLTAATEHQRRGDHRRAAENALRVAESVSIGICGSADCFPLVEAWEAGQIDFDTYTTRLAQALDDKDVPGAAEFRFSLMAAEKLGNDWDENASPESQSLCARSVIGNAAWSAVAGVDLRKKLGRAPKVPYKDLPELILRAYDRL